MTEVGGLSGIVYNPKKEVYYALSDDRSQINPARFYTLNVVSDNNFSETQKTQFIALALDIKGSPVSGELPKYENTFFGTDVIGILGITVWVFLQRLWRLKKRR